MQFRMKVVKGKPQGHCLTFPSGEFMFGRGPECDVRPNSDLVSRQHCLVQVTGLGAYIRDLGSRNGTLVNGQLVVGERELHHGDTVQLGPLVLEIMLDEAPGAAQVSLGDTALVNHDETKTNQTEMAQTVEGPLPLPQESSVTSGSPHQ